jgi:hypothetical protein
MIPQDPRCSLGFEVGVFLPVVDVLNRVNIAVSQRPHWRKALDVSYNHGLTRWTYNDGGCRLCGYIDRRTLARLTSFGSNWDMFCSLAFQQYCG